MALLGPFICRLFCTTMQEEKERGKKQWDGTEHGVGQPAKEAEEQQKQCSESQEGCDDSIPKHGSTPGPWACILGPGAVTTSFLLHLMDISRQTLPHLESSCLPGGYYLQQCWLLQNAGCEKQCPREHLSSGPGSCFVCQATPRRCRISYTLKKQLLRHFTIPVWKCAFLLHLDVLGMQQAELLLGNSSYSNSIHGAFLAPSHISLLPFAPTSAGHLQLVACSRWDTGAR